jgi:hypothetical protein
VTATRITDVQWRVACLQDRIRKVEAAARQASADGDVETAERLVAEAIVAIATEDPVWVP